MTWPAVSFSSLWPILGNLLMLIEAGVIIRANIMWRSERSRLNKKIDKYENQKRIMWKELHKLGGGV